MRKPIEDFTDAASLKTLMGNAKRLRDEDV